MDNYSELLDFSGDGYIEIGERVGVLSRHFMTIDEDFELYVYHMRRARRNHHIWTLERIEDLSDYREEYDWGSSDDIPSDAYAYFAGEPDFDYLTFEDDGFDAAIEWDPQYTIRDIIEMNEE